MNTTLQQKATKLFNNPMVAESLNKYNQEAYIKAMLWLGDKHILATYVGRKVC